MRLGLELLLKGRPVQADRTCVIKQTKSKNVAKENRCADYFLFDVRDIMCDVTDHNHQCAPASNKTTLQKLAKKTCGLFASVISVHV